MNKITKSNEDIQKMINTLQAEIDQLPAVGLFGSNAESIRESKQWVKELQAAKEKKISSDEWNDVRRWVCGKNSALDDYNS